MGIGDGESVLDAEQSRIRSGAWIVEYRHPLHSLPLLVLLSSSSSSSSSIHLLHPPASPPSSPPTLLPPPNPPSPPPPPPPPLDPDYARGRLRRHLVCTPQEIPPRPKSPREGAARLTPVRADPCSMLTATPTRVAECKELRQGLVDWSQRCFRGLLLSIHFHHQPVISHPVRPWRN